VKLMIDGANHKAMAYDLLGNITRKSDISTGYVYGGPGPHVVTLIATCGGWTVNDMATPLSLRRQSICPAPSPLQSDAAASRSAQRCTSSSP
jgi:hypothetical protein